MKDRTDLAKLAYHAYGQNTDFKNFQGNPMPQWEDLPDRIKEGWIAAAKAIEFQVSYGITDSSAGITCKS